MDSEVDISAGPKWLPIQDSQWVARNRYFLEGIWRRLLADGGWPDPVELQRELRAEDGSRRVSQALAEMPAYLVRIETWPPSIGLTVFGLGCIEGGRELLAQYLQVARLALDRFDLPQLPNRLDRRYVVDALGLSPGDAAV